MHILIYMYALIGSLVSIVGTIANYEDHKANYSYVGNFVLRYSGEQLKVRL